MPVKKKNNKSLGSEVAAFSLYNEDYEEAMRKFKEELEAKRTANQKIFKEYEKKYNKVLDDNYKRLVVGFLDSLGLNLYVPLKEAMSNPENVEALNVKKDFSVLLEKNNEFIEKVLEFIVSDELVRTAIDEYVDSLKAATGNNVAEQESAGNEAKNNVSEIGDDIDVEASEDKKEDVESNKDSDDEFGVSLM